MSNLAARRYLTGAYLQEESPEGGRFKKEIVIDGSSYLLLIRHEGGSPELRWVFLGCFVYPSRRLLYYVCLMLVSFWLNVDS